MANLLTTYWKLHRTAIILALLSLTFYYAFAYHLARTDFTKLLAAFIGMFFLCYKLIQFEKWNFKFLLGIGIVFRLIFLLVEPNLSQDFYRFIWDGELVQNWFNPYLEVPNTLIEQKNLVIANAQTLHEGMGPLSARHFSNYPPLNQLIFALTSFLGADSVLGSVIAMRIVIILADIGVFYFGRKLLRNLNRSPHLIFWYFLNPLVIVELSGNLHFEGVMLFFFVLALYLISVKKWKLGAVVYALSISIKLVPLIFLPLFLKHFGWKKSIAFYALVGITSIALLLPFYSSEFIDNYAQTVSLWFSNFEFNAGLYNGIKKLALQFDAKPWELIKTYGKITPWITILSVVILTFFRNNQKLPVLMGSMLWALTLYYFTSTTVHPWYLVFLVTLCIFTEYRFAILWSAAVVLSYFAYSNTDFKESLWLLSIEYLSVYAFLGYEIITRHGKKVLFGKNEHFDKADSN